jgi:FtsZ-binding cell division protein ZapB
VFPLLFAEYLAVELIFYASSKHMDKHERPYICTVDGCDHRQGFTSKGDLSRHQRIVHKLDNGQGSLLFCHEPNCARGPGGGPNAGFSRSDNLADHIRRRHGQSAVSSYEPRVEIANDTILPGVRLESPRRMDREPVTSLQRKRRRISEMELISQNSGQGTEEEINLRSELRKARERVEELTEELKEVQRKYDERIQVLLGIVERLTQQSK